MGLVVHREACSTEGNNCQYFDSEYFLDDKDEEEREVRGER